MGIINILKHLEIQGNFKALFFLGWLCLGLLSAWSCCAFTSKHLLEHCFLTFSWERLYDILGYAEGNLGEFAIKMVKTAITFPIYYVVMRTINIKWNNTVNNIYKIPDEFIFIEKFEYSSMNITFYALKWLHTISNKNFSVSSNYLLSSWRKYFYSTVSPKTIKQLLQLFSNYSN